MSSSKKSAQSSGAQGKAPTDRFPGVSVHASAVIDDNVVIGKGTRIWHFCHILKSARIGRDCSFGQNVMVGAGVVIGDKVKVQNNVSLYEGLVIEDEVFCGPSAVFTNVMNPRSAVDRKHEFKPTILQRGATIGANATVICGLTIGRYAFIGAGAVVTHDVPDHALVVGVPARRIGWMSAHGEKLDDDLVCPATGELYERHKNGLRPVISAGKSES